MDCSTPGLPVHHQLKEFTQTHVHWVSDTIQPPHPLSIPLFSHLQSFPASGSFPMSQFFAWGDQSIGSFSFSISPSNECSGLISFRMDWLDLLAVQGTLKSLLQHHSSKASILQRSAFFIIQLSPPYTTTGKTIALTRWTFITLSTFVRQQVSKPYVVAFFFLKNFSLLISLVHNLSSSSKENNCYIFVLFGLSGRTPNWHFLMKAIVIANVFLFLVTFSS